MGLRGDFAIRYDIPKSATNRAVEQKLGRSSKKGKNVCLAAKYWCIIVQIGRDEALRSSYE
jgi:hypothetical protein